jgi:hypothetical protein
MAGDRLDQQAMLRNREGMRAACLAVPAGDARKAMGDVLDLDIERRGVEQIEPPAREHALPGARRSGRFGHQAVGRVSRARAAHSCQRKQPVRWSLTMPQACITA